MTHKRSITDTEFRGRIEATANETNGYGMAVVSDSDMVRVKIDDLLAEENGNAVAAAEIGEEVTLFGERDGNWFTVVSICWHDR